MISVSCLVYREEALGDAILAAHLTPMLCLNTVGYHVVFENCFRGEVLSTDFALKRCISIFISRMNTHVYIISTDLTEPFVTHFAFIRLLASMYAFVLLKSKFIFESFIANFACVHRCG